MNDLKFTLSESIIIITNNAMIKNGENVGGYHEIHEIKGIRNVNHLIATIKSIAENNIRFKDDDTTLVGIYVSCTSDTLEKESVDYFKEIRYTPEVYRL